MAWSFAASWRDTNVIFIPKPGGKGCRLISLSSSVCNLFERMVQRRLEYQAENCNWIQNYQFGFRRGRSAMDAVAMVTTDILQGFGCSGTRNCGLGVPQGGRGLSPNLFNIYTSRILILSRLAFAMLCMQLTCSLTLGAERSRSPGMRSLERLIW